MSKRKQNTIAFKRENLINRLRILLIAVLTIITFYPPYLQGLYFEKHVLPTQIIVFVTFIVFLIYKLLKKDYTFFRTPIDYACLGFVIVYFISIFVAVHTRSAIIEWLKYCMCFAVFYMISDLADNQKTKLLFLWTIIISAFGVSVIGLDAAFGGNFVRILNKFFNQLGVKGDLFFGLYSNNRIHSTLQYANALASYLMAVFFVTVGLLMFYNKWWQNVILGIFAYILFVTFMLTQSRGTQFLFPLVVIILFIAAPKGNRIKTLTCTLLLAITAGVAALFIAPYLSENYFNKKVLLPLLIGLFITILISMVIKDIGSLLQKIDWRIYLIIISAIVITFTVGAIYLINSSEPVELSLLNSAENKIISISKDVALKSNKNYILKFEAEGKMTGDKPYVFMVKLNSKNLNDILFGYSSQLTKQEFTVTNGLREFSVSFYTNEDTKLVNVDFSIYYSGTYVKINNISIIDKDSGKIVKKVALKNKYDLDNIISRFQNLLFQRSLILRIVYYKDGFNMFKDRWLLGAGGGAWNYLYRQYQSYNYASSQAHNYPLQVGIETGILGIFNLMFLVIVLIIYYKKYYKKDYNNFIYASIFSAILALFMHSIIDFDFAESSMLLLFWSFIALFNSELIDKLEFKDFKLFDIEIKRNDYNKKNIFLIIAGILFSGVTLYFSSAFFNASLYAKQSFESFQNGDIENAINKMEKAINWDRYNETYVIGYNPVQTKPDIKAGLIDILFTKNEIYNSVQNESGNISDTELKIFQNQFFEALLYLKNIEKKAQNNLSLSSALASFYFRIGDIAKGMNYLDAAISYFPFEPSLWHLKVELYYRLMKEYFNNEEYDKAKDYLLKGLSVIDEAKNVNKWNMNPFVFNDNTIKLLQTMRYMLDNWNTDGIFDVNNIIHYSMFDLDINMDGIPDQWKMDDDLKSNITNNGELSIKTADWSYIYTQYPINLEKGKTYRIEVLVETPVSSISYYITGITQKSLSFINDKNKYFVEFTVEKEQNEEGNLIRIYVKDDCIVKNVLIKEITN